MSTRLRFTQDWKSYKKGDVAELRSGEAKQAIKEKVATVQTDLAPAEYQTKVNHQTKDSSDGNTQRLRTNKSRRR